MTRKEALKDIAQRCMNGDEPSVQELLILTSNTGILKLAEWSSLGAVAQLEAELLHDGWMIDVAVSEKMTVARTFKLAECTSEATAPKEPLARLAALCLALAEMEEE